MTELTMKNLAKVTRYRKDGQSSLEALVTKESRLLSKAIRTKEKDAGSNTAISSPAA